MRTLRRVATWLIFFSLLVIGGATASAQEPIGDAFGEVIDVRVINVEVVVTDRDGNRVTGLGPDDFVIEIDGREVPIEYFTEVIGGTAAAPPEPPSGGEVSAEFTLPRAEPGEPVGTSYLVFIDTLFSRPGDRDLVLQKLAESVAGLRPEDRMAIVAYTGQLQMLTSWTNNAATLQRVIDNARFGFIAGWTAVAAPLREELAVGELDNLSGYEDFLSAADQAYGAYSRVGQEYERLIAAANSTLRSFANPPGRKVMMLMAGRWPQGQLRSRTTRGWNWTPQKNTDLVVAEQLSETANLLGYTIYPIQVSTSTRQSGDARQRGPTQRRAENPRVLRAPYEPLILENTLFSQGTLRAIADDTGGRALFWGERLDAFDRVAEDTRSYYWLGFIPERNHDDDEHEIDVDVRQRGLKVRARENFTDLSRNRERGMLAESELLFGNHLQRPEIPVTIAGIEDAGWRKMKVAFEVVVPIEKLTVIPGAADAVAARGELRIIVQDPQGNRSRVPSLPITFTNAELAELGDAVELPVRLTMRDEPHVVLFALWDEASGRQHYTRVVALPQGDNDA
ncbi:MAG: VWA domain-containing protein [Acidobacteriota bacterium]